MDELETLLAAKSALEAQIEAARRKVADAALLEVQALIVKFGFTQRQVFPTKSVDPVYQDPVTGRTWAGRGKTPKWIAGKNKADFLVRDDE